MTYLSVISLLLSVVIILRNNKLLITKSLTSVWLLLIIFQWIFIETSISYGECRYYYVTRICYSGLEKAGLIVFICTIFLFFINEYFIRPNGMKYKQNFNINIFSKSFFKPTISPLVIISTVFIALVLVSGGLPSISTFINISSSSDSRNVGTLLVVVLSSRVLYLKQIIQRKELSVYYLFSIISILLFSLLFSRLKTLILLYEIFIASNISTIYQSPNLLGTKKIKEVSKLSNYLKQAVLVFFGLLIVIIYGSIRDIINRDNYSFQDLSYSYIIQFAESIYYKQVETFTGLAAATNNTINNDFSYVINYCYNFVLSFVTALTPTATAKDLLSSFLNTNNIYSSTVIPSVLEFGYLSFGIIGVLVVVINYYFICMKLDSKLRSFVLASNSENAAMITMFGISFVFTLRGSPWIGLADGVAAIVLSLFYLSLTKIINKKILS